MVAASTGDVDEKHTSCVNQVGDKTPTYQFIHAYHLQRGNGATVSHAPGWPSTCGCQVVLCQMKLSDEVAEPLLGDMGHDRDCDDHPRSNIAEGLRDRKSLPIAHVPFHGRVM